MAVLKFGKRFPTLMIEKNLLLKFTRNNRISIIKMCNFGAYTSKFDCTMGVMYLNKTCCFNISNILSLSTF